MPDRSKTVFVMLVNDDGMTRSLTGNDADRWVSPVPVFGENPSPASWKTGKMPGRHPGQPETVENLREGLVATLAKVAALEEQIKIRDGHLSLAREENEDLKGAADTREGDNDILRGEVEAKTAALAEAERQIGCLNERLAEVGEENRHLRDEVARLSQALKDANEVGAQRFADWRRIEDANNANRDLLKKIVDALPSNRRSVQPGWWDLPGIVRRLHSDYCAADINATRAEANKWDAVDCVAGVLYDIARGIKRDRMPAIVVRPSVANVVAAVEKIRDQREQAVKSAQEALNAPHPCPASHLDLGDAAIDQYAFLVMREWSAGFPFPGPQFPNGSHRKGLFESIKQTAEHLRIQIDQMNDGSLANRFAQVVYSTAGGQTPPAVVIDPASNMATALEAVRTLVQRRDEAIREVAACRKKIDDLRAEANREHGVASNRLRALNAICKEVMGHDVEFTPGMEGIDTQTLLHTLRTRKTEAASSGCTPGVAGPAGQPTASRADIDLRINHRVSTAFSALTKMADNGIASAFPLDLGDSTVSAAARLAYQKVTSLRAKYDNLRSRVSDALTEE